MKVVISVYIMNVLIGSELASLESLCQQDLPQADIAIVYDWESRWALNASCGPKKAVTVHPYPSDIYTEACQAHYRANGCRAVLMCSRRSLNLPIIKHW